MSDIVVRAVRPEDADPVSEILQDPEVCRGTAQVPSLEYTRWRERFATEQKGVYRFVAEIDGKVVGSVSLHQGGNPRLAHSASLGIAIHRGYWNRGVGSALMQAVVDLADRWLNLQRIELTVNTDNAPAVHLYEKFGFEVEGTKRKEIFSDGKFKDGFLMARVK